MGMLPAQNVLMFAPTYEFIFMVKLQNCKLSSGTSQRTCMMVLYFLFVWVCHQLRMYSCLQLYTNLFLWCALQLCLMLYTCLKSFANDLSSHCGAIISSSQGAFKLLLCHMIKIICLFNDVGIFCCCQINLQGSSSLSLKRLLSQWRARQVMCEKTNIIKTKIGNSEIWQ